MFPGDSKEKAKVPERYQVGGSEMRLPIETESSRVAHGRISTQSSRILIWACLLVFKSSRHCSCALIGTDPSKGKSYWIPAA